MWWYGKIKILILRWKKIIKALVARCTSMMPKRSGTPLPISGAVPSPSVEKQYLPRVLSQKDIAPHNGLKVTVIGTYRQIDIRYKQQSKTEYSGYVGIALSDGQIVMLEPSWSAAALRSNEEVLLFNGKLVSVIGILHAEAPPPEEPSAALVTPCLRGVQSIECVLDQK
ncbi:hypothetical protein [Celerinatantimonas sp. MCCC 1A17872]|uniref:hypothetical protein n=1 Tax=Celerinatantimonas sp. MCCC 1A17872 TaxID=3177514 RepID=UPI0038C1CDE1